MLTHNWFSYLSGGPCARSETLQVGKNLSTFLFDTLLWSKRFKTQGLGLNWYSPHAKSLSPSHGHPAPGGLKMRLWIYKIREPWRCFIAWVNEREGERQHVRQREGRRERERDVTCWKTAEEETEDSIQRSGQSSKNRLTLLSPRSRQLQAAKHCCGVRALSSRCTYNLPWGI